MIPNYPRRMEDLMIMAKPAEERPMSSTDTGLDARTRPSPLATGPIPAPVGSTLASLVNAALELLPEWRAQRREDFRRYDRALALLAPRWPGLALRVVGDGEQLPALIRMVRERGLGDRVVFTGRLSWWQTLTEVSRARPLWPA